MNYTDREKIKNYIDRELTDSEESILADMIDYAEDFIDIEAGRTFKTTNAEEKYYDGTGKVNLYIDDCLEVTSVEEIDENGDVVNTLVANEDYEPFPYNKLPFTILIARGWCWTRGVKNFKVTGDWGVATKVPKKVSLAATILVGEVLNNPEMLESESIEGYQKTFGKIENPVLSKILGSISSRTLI